jgi:hypothetical protein
MAEKHHPLWFSRAADQYLVQIMYGQPSFVNHNDHHLQVVVVTATATATAVIIIWYCVPMRHTVPTQLEVSQREASIRMMECYTI